MISLIRLNVTKLGLNQMSSQKSQLLLVWNTYTLLSLIFHKNILPKGGFFSESVMKFFQISKSQKKNIPKNYPELEI